MRAIAVHATLVAIALAAAGCGNKELGHACESDRECRDGTCFDLSEVQDFCHGKVCTQACEQDSDCPPGPGRGNCEHLPGRNVCLYAGWVPEHCTIPGIPAD